VGKKFVEEKFPHLTYSDKECDDSKKKELRIVVDEIQQVVFSHMRSLLRWKMKMQVSGTICCRIPTSWHLLMKLKKTVSCVAVFFPQK